jgi:hypothetical protein
MEKLTIRPEAKIPMRPMRLVSTRVRSVGCFVSLKTTSPDFSAPSYPIQATPRTPTQSVRANLAINPTYPKPSIQSPDSSDLDDGSGTVVPVKAEPTAGSV